jgi:hypothetical protein
MILMRMTLRKVMPVMEIKKKKAAVVVVTGLQIKKVARRKNAKKLKIIMPVCK